jgi:hypothetical protein
MCTHITIDLQCTNMHNDVHTYHNGFTMYKHTQWFVHILQWMYNVQTYTMVCTYITMDLAMYKYTQWCVHISHWMYNIQTYTMVCTHITIDLQCINIYNYVYTYHNGLTMYKYTQECVHISQWI